MGERVVAKGLIVQGAELVKTKDHRVLLDSLNLGRQIVESTGREQIAAIRKAAKKNDVGTVPALISIVIRENENADREDVEEFDEACKALQKIEHTDAQFALAINMLASGEHQLIRAACTVLVCWSDSRAIPHVIDFLSSPDSQIRYDAACVFETMEYGREGDEVLKATLMRYYKHETDDSVKRALRSALGTMGVSNEEFGCDGKPT